MAGIIRKFRTPTTRKARTRTRRRPEPVGQARRDQVYGLLMLDNECRGDGPKSIEVVVSHGTPVEAQIERFLDLYAFPKRGPQGYSGMLQLHRSNPDPEQGLRPIRSMTFWKLQPTTSQAAANFVEGAAPADHVAYTATTRIQIGQRDHVEAVMEARDRIETIVMNRLEAEGEAIAKAEAEAEVPEETRVAIEEIHDRNDELEEEVEEALEEGAENQVAHNDYMSRKMMATADRQQVADDARKRAQKPRPADAPHFHGRNVALQERYGIFW